MGDDIKEEKEEEVIEEAIKEETISQEEVIVEEGQKQENEEVAAEEKKHNKRLKYLLVIIGIIFLIGIIVAVICIGIKNNKKVGNTISNIQDYGYICSDGNYIYYQAIDENDYEKIAIYRCKKNGEGKKVLISGNWSVYGLNVYKNYIYFVGINNLDDKYSEDDEIDNKIYRMKKNGKKLEIINDNNFYNESKEIYVVKNKVYYIGEDLNIYNMDLNGKNKNVINDERTGYIGVSEDYIIYNNVIKNEDGTQKVATHIMELDGTNKKVLTGERLSVKGIYNNDLYYINSNKEVCKMNLKTSEITTVSKTTAYLMNVTEKYIYYMSVDAKGTTLQLCRMNLDGSKETKLIDLNSFSPILQVVLDKVFYIEYSLGEVNLLNPETLNISNLFTFDFEREENEETVQDTTSADTTN